MSLSALDRGCARPLNITLSRHARNDKNRERRAKTDIRLCCRKGATRTYPIERAPTFCAYCPLGRFPKRHRLGIVASRHRFWWCGARVGRRQAGRERVQVGETVPMKIAIPKERRPHEGRVAATPDTVKRMIALGLDVAVETGAGSGASFPDSAYAAVGAAVAPDAVATVAGADIVLKVQRPMLDGGA